MCKSLPGVSSGARGLKLCASLHLRPYFVYVSSEGETADAQARLSLVRVFSDVLVAFLYFDICHYRQSNLAIKNPELSQPVVAGHFQ